MYWLLEVAIITPYVLMMTAPSRRNMYMHLISKFMCCVDGLFLTILWKILFVYTHETKSDIISIDQLTTA